MGIWQRVAVVAGVFVVCTIISDRLQDAYGSHWWTSAVRSIPIACTILLWTYGTRPSG